MFLTRASSNSVRSGRGRSSAFSGAGTNAIDGNFDLSRLPFLSSGTKVCSIFGSSLSILTMRPAPSVVCSNLSGWLIPCPLFPRPRPARNPNLVNIFSALVPCNCGLSATSWQFIAFASTCWSRSATLRDRLLPGRAALWGLGGSALSSDAFVSNSILPSVPISQDSTRGGGVPAAAALCFANRSAPLCSAAPAVCSDVIFESPRLRCRGDRRCPDCSKFGTIGRPLLP